MGFLDSLREKVLMSKDKLLTEISKYRNETFMEGVVAAAVLIAAADGQISSEEKQKLFGYVKQADELKAFSTDDVIAVFKKITDAYEFDAAIGKAEALKRVGRLKGKEEQARLVVHVGIAIANSDGNFDDSEKKAVHDLCVELGVPPSDFSC